MGNDWISNPEYLWITLLMPVGMGLGALTFGHISDTLFRFDRYSSIWAGMLAGTFIAILIYYTSVSNLWGSAVLMFSAGFLIYGPQANFWPLCPELLGEKYSGTGTGLMNMTCYLFAALGEPVLGWLIDFFHSTSIVFIAVAIICLLSAITISLCQKQKMVIVSA